MTVSGIVLSQRQNPRSSRGTSSGNKSLFLLAKALRTCEECRRVRNPEEIRPPSLRVDRRSPFPFLFPRGFFLAYHLGLSSPRRVGLKALMLLLFPRFPPIRAPPFPTNTPSLQLRAFSPPPKMENREPLNVPSPQRRETEWRFNLRLVFAS